MERLRQKAIFLRAERTTNVRDFVGTEGIRKLTQASFGKNLRLQEVTQICNVVVAYLSAHAFIYPCCPTGVFCITVPSV